MGIFLKLVRKGTIPSPTTPKWTQVAWDRAFTASAPHEDSDRAIFAAGNWFARQLASHRTLVPELSTFGLTPPELIRAAVAGINRNWIVMSDKLKPQDHPGDIVIAEQLLSRRLTIEPWNIEADPDGLVQASVDSIRHIIFASGAPAATRAKVGQILEALLRRSIVASAYLTLETLWMDCLWNSWAVFEDTAVDIVRPTELRHAAAHAAAAFRGQTLRFSQHGDVQRSWLELPSEIQAGLADYRVVRELRGAGRDLEIRTRQHRDDEPPGAHVLRMTGADAWLDRLIDQDLPKLTSISPWALLKAWDFVCSFAVAAEQRMPRDTGVFEMSKLWSYAPAVEVRTLVKSLASSLGVAQSTARVLLDLLAIESAKDTDPWLTPLWRLDDRYFIMVPVALTSNPRRLIEHWLTVGGIDLGIRGPLFEQYVRDECAEGIAGSPVLRRDARCAPRGVELDPSIGDIDLLCLIGNTVLVGEIKCTTTPASPVERANYFGILHEAAEQVLVKVAHAKNNVAALAAATGWSLSHPAFVGVVVTNQEVGVGQCINGIPVVDALILTKYFGDHVLEHGVMFSPDGEKSLMGKTTFYRTIGEAERNLETYLLAPPQLRLALGHLAPMETPFLIAPSTKPFVYRDFAVRLPSMR